MQLFGIDFCSLAITNLYVFLVFLLLCKSSAWQSMYSGNVKLNVLCMFGVWCSVHCCILQRGGYLKYICATYNTTQIIYWRLTLIVLNFNLKIDFLESTIGQPEATQFFLSKWILLFTIANVIINPNRYPYNVYAMSSITWKPFNTQLHLTSLSVYGYT